MNCPVCDATLRTVSKHNVEVEICPDCKGVWLDRGELDKIIEIASGDAPAPQVEERRESREPHGHHEDERRGHDRDRDERKREDSGHHGKEEYDSRTGKPRKKSMLGEIFGMIGGGED